MRQQIDKLPNKLKEKEMTSFFEEISAKGNSPGKRFGHVICPVSRAKICLFGGAAGERFETTNDTFLLDLASATWKKLESTKTLVAFHSNLVHGRVRRGQGALDGVCVVCF